MSSLTDLPSVERILQTDTAKALSRDYGRPLTIRAIRETLQKFRAQLLANTEITAPPPDAILVTAASLLKSWTNNRLRPVINATGVILHTNLGRAPLSRSTIAAMGVVARGYATVEFDLETGKRGPRAVDAEAALEMLTGAEAALVVNNNAAAVTLTLATLAPRKRVLVARSQLVEIGGGFRMPEVMRVSGARLLEVGTTNKVRLADYEACIADAAAVLRAHRSNFQMVGFTEEPDLKPIAELAHRAGKVVIDDLGSGALIDTLKFGLAHEPMVQESLAAGADVVCFSGDKLVGGPQAGLIVGRAEMLSKIRRHPLARAVRADKLTLAGTSATLMHYLRDEVEDEIPVWQMARMPVQEIEGRAREWQRELSTGEVQPDESTLGGGSLPGETLPTRVLVLRAAHPDHALMRLREQEPPIVARIDRHAVILDPRTVQPEEERDLLRGLRIVLTEMQ